MAKNAKPSDTFSALKKGTVFDRDTGRRVFGIAGVGVMAATLAVDAKQSAASASERGDSKTAAVGKEVASTVATVAAFGAATGLAAKAIMKTGVRALPAFGIAGGVIGGIAGAVQGAREGGVFGALKGGAFGAVTGAVPVLGLHAGIKALGDRRAELAAPKPDASKVVYDKTGKLHTQTAIDSFRRGR